MRNVSMRAVAVALVLLGCELAIVGLALSPVPWAALLAAGVVLAAVGLFAVPTEPKRARR